MLRITFGTIFVGVALNFYHSILSQGFLYSISLFLLIYLYAFAIELIGLHSHWPFGNYQYSSSLGYSLWKLPLIVPAAWIVMVYPIGTLIKRIKSNWSFLYGAIGLVIWDLFLDPLMVDAGRWQWLKVKPALFFSKEIPLSNPVGWLLSGIGLMALISKFPMKRRKTNPSFWVPYLLIIWTIFSSIIGNLFFFHHAKLALIAGLLFIIWVLPLLYQVQFGQREI